MRIIGLSAVLLATLSLSGASATSEIMPSALISDETWKSVNSLCVSNQKPEDNDMSELLARLVVVSHGDELSHEALRRTVARANNRKGGLGVWDNGGIKRMFAAYILTVADQQMKLEEASKQIELLSAQVSLMRIELDKLKAESKDSAKRPQ
ncbi:MAG: hypothetical protein ACM3KM_00525 [Acidobacteriaceae bacterium]